MVKSGLKLYTKYKLYRFFLLPYLLYSADLHTVSVSSLAYMTNGEVLQKAKMESVGLDDILVKSQLRWAGHMVRMPDDILPKAVITCWLGPMQS